jgi:ribonucleoside-triphosphate reductase
MGTMLKYGSESAKQFYEMCVIDPRFAKAHREGDIHIHDMDFYTLTTTCCQIELKKLFKGGFSTGHGVLREPNDIASYTALACIAIQSNQNDQHGGQAICDFDYGLADGVRKTYRRLYKKHLAEALDLLTDIEDEREFAQNALAEVEAETGKVAALDVDAQFHQAVATRIEGAGIDAAVAERIVAYTEKNAERDTDRATFQAMEALVHNLNTMHSRAGAQTPFSSVNYGMDTSAEGRMVIKNMLLATEEGLGHGETPIFPVQIFRVKEGVNYNPGDPNYDLFKLAMHCSAKRLFPNFSFLDAPFNAQYYKGTPETEIAYMGCRTRVMGNVYDPDREVTPGRGNLSFTSINLPRLAIRAKGDLDLFFDLLDSKLRLVTGQLDERFEIQCRKKVYNAPFLMGQGVWIDSEKLSPDDEQREVLKHGTLTTGFIGLAECLVALTGHHHGESEESQRLGLEIIGHMRNYCDRISKERGLNYTLIATPAEGLSGRFVRMDRERYGVIKGVTDHDFYTNGFHVPVYYDITAFDKIKTEAPYHALTNGGHISYIELDGDPSDNLEAFESVIRFMKESGMGYGSVNHPVDRDPVCGYNGIIEDECPGCGRHEGDGKQNFERIRRITGYLVGTLDRFNDAKRAEESERVKHAVPTAKKAAE